MLDGEQFTAAALCIGGTAFAASAQSWFPLLFTHGGDAGLEGYVQMADNAKLADENEYYRLSVESVLFDESAGTGVISLHLENKQQDGVKPFTLAHLLDSYRNKPDMTWTTLSSCYAEEGQLAFEVMYGDSGFCGGEFYLDTARSTDNDYYLEGAFAISGDYRQGEPLRLEALEPGKTTVRADGAGTAKTVLAVDLPGFQQMPYLTSENGDVTLSQIGIRIRNADMHCTVDDVDTLSVQLKDGSEYVILDENADIDRTLYTCGFNSTEDTDRIDTEIAVLARAFDLDNVQSVTINGEVYPLS